MVEPSTLAKGALAAVRVGRAVGPLIAAYLGKDSNALAELMREGDAAWVTQFCEQLREKQEVLDQRFREVHPLITSLRWEAARDATDGRRRMLAYIAAHLLNSSESVESKARVERTVRDLDPADTALLAMLYSLRPGPAFSVWERNTRRSNLNTCVEIDYRPLAGAGGVGKPTLSVSETGRLVLNALQDFHAEELLAGFDQVISNVRLADWIAKHAPAPPFWVTRRTTHPLRVLVVGGGPSITGELFSWNREHSAYVLCAVTEHAALLADEWTVLQPKSDASFLRQDNLKDGRPLIPCDPLAPPTEAELEFMRLPER